MKLQIVAHNHEPFASCCFGSCINAIHPVFMWESISQWDGSNSYFEWATTIYMKQKGRKRIAVSLALPAVSCSSSRSPLSSWSSCSGRLWRGHTPVQASVPLRLQTRDNYCWITEPSSVNQNEHTTHILLAYFEIVISSRWVQQHKTTAEIERILKLKMGCLTLLTEVTGKAVVQVLVELGAMSPFQSCAEPEVR